jgi:CHAT domain-containing protein
MPGRLRGDGTQSDESVRATTVSDISMSEIDARSRPIVVLNACQSARAGYQLRGMGGFAQAFVHAGAGVFVGTHWSVGDAQASTFITRFYESFLLDGRRSSLSEATATARKAAKRKGDATWLAFVVYGHPRARAIAI